MIEAKGVKIDMSGPRKGCVVVDGVEVKGVTSLRFEAGKDNANRLTLELTPGTARISGTAEVVERAKDAEISGSWNASAFIRFESSEGEAIYLRIADILRLDPVYSAGPGANDSPRVRRDLTAVVTADDRIRVKGTTDEIAARLGWTS